MQLNQRRRLYWIWAMTLIVAFCSIVYELMLAQCLSIILGNTVLRYSLTIGLYLFSLGMGALAFAFWRRGRVPELLLGIELVLATFGLCLPFLILGGDQFLRQSLSSYTSSPISWLPSWVFMHAVIVIVGLLSGAELPILMDLGREEGGADAAQRVLAIDYVGTFVGALAFPLLIYENLGLVAGAALVGGLNAGAALMVLSLYPQTRRRMPLMLCTSSLCLAIALIINEESLRGVLVNYVFG